MGRLSLVSITFHALISPLPTAGSLRYSCPFGHLLSITNRSFVSLMPGKNCFTPNHGKPQSNIHKILLWA